MDTTTDTTATPTTAPAVVTQIERLTLVACKEKKDRLEAQVALLRANLAQLLSALEATNSSYNGQLQSLKVTYSLSDTDTIDLDTGVLSRGK